MAMMDSASWNTHDHQGLHAGADDDFQFLDMGNMGNISDGLQFDFQDFQNAGGAAAMLSQPPRDQMDTPMGGTDGAVMISRGEAVVPSQMPPMAPATSHPPVTAQMMAGTLPTPAEAIVAIDAQIQYLQQQKLQQQQQQLQDHTAYYGTQIPPTPRSLELQANGHPFFSPNQVSQQQAVFDSRFQHLKEQQDMAFTPLVSPAVTPLDPNFPVDASFTVPGAYFSPLTSPALHAQNDPVQAYDQRPSSTSTNSPGNTELDSGGPSATAADLSKKARKNVAAKGARKSNVRQSPISKPQRRKTGSTAQTRVNQVLSEMSEGGEPSRDGPTPMSLESPDIPEENASVSPEDLSEMPPPPVPLVKSAGRSPFIRPQNGSQTPTFAPSSQGKPSPATPATLMKLPVSSAPNSTPSNPAEPTTSDPIETFELPPPSAAFPKPKLSTLDTQSTPQPQATPPSEAGSARAPSFQPLPSPVFAKPTAAASASQSPQLMPGSNSGNNVRKTPQLAARGSKKRASASSVHVSPALRPKISPNIKPLLPGAAGVSAEDTAQRLLMSKSNYQNILEGNTVPGVSYPSELSTNLTSKRTSHKIAEQGRRNRINSALQEIATLLPKSVTKAGIGGKGSDGEGESEGKKDGKNGSNNVPNSKASTVEMAIEYIKQLQQEVAEAKKRADEAEKKLEMQSGGKND